MGLDLWPMALLSLLHYPDARLRTVAKPITDVTDEIRQLAADMAETMYDAPGVGLAATQVDRHIRMIVVDVSEEQNDLVVLINPEITEASPVTKPHEEGCLSVPGIYDTVVRPDRIHVRAQDLQGDWFEIEADGLLSVCIQHEIDHLNGKVFVDTLSRLKQSRIQAKLLKQKRDKKATAAEHAAHPAALDY